MRLARGPTAIVATKPAITGSSTRPNAPCDSCLRPYSKNIITSALSQGCTRTGRKYQEGSGLPASGRPSTQLDPHSTLNKQSDRRVLWSDDSSFNF